MPSLSSTLEKLHLRKASHDAGRQSSSTATSSNRTEKGPTHPTSPSQSPSVSSAAAANRSSHDHGLKTNDSQFAASEQRGSSSLERVQQEADQSKPLPRSPASYELPPIPSTPDIDVRHGQGQWYGQGNVQGQGQRRTQDGLSDSKQGRGDQDVKTKTIGRDHAVWAQGKDSQVIATKHDLTLPQPLFDTTTMPSIQSTRSHLSTGPVNEAYIASRSFSYNPFPPAASQEEHDAHLNKHLALLNPRIFQPTAHVAQLEPGKILPLHAPGPIVSMGERNQVLDAQREELTIDIVESEEVARAGGKRLPVLNEKALEVFERIGWEDRVKVADTLDVYTTVLPPVIQERVVPVETVTYQLVIFREVHKYHIYPFIQPIRDPSPTILPTRHLFRDRDGNLREVIGDEAAERVLGRKLTASDGETYVERWIEGVDGIEYEAEWRKIEEESVRVGRRGWVERVGQRLKRDDSYVEQLAQTDGGRYMSRQSQSAEVGPGGSNGDSRIGRVTPDDAGTQRL